MVRVLPLPGLCAGTPGGGRRFYAVQCTERTRSGTENGAIDFTEQTMNTARLLACLALALCSMASAASRAEPNAPEWIADAHGCKVSNPQRQAVDSIRWSGRCKDGYAQGQGTVEWFSGGRADGVTSGRFFGGRLMGKGYVTRSHSVYSQVKVAKRQVAVARGWPAGSRLEGEFFEDELVGDGLLTKPNGQKLSVTQVDGRLVRR